MSWFTQWKPYVPFMGYVVSPYTDAVTARMSEAIRNPGKRVTHEVRFQHADGSWRIMEGVGVNRLDDPSVGAIVMNVAVQGISPPPPFWMGT